MVTANLRLVVMVCRRYRGRISNLQLEMLDLYQAGNLGLMRAIELFDPSRGYRLSTYAFWWIQQAVQRCMSATGNGTLLYQWQHEGTNLLFNATSATLTLTNIQPAQAGDYSVLVADDLGSVTSAVASLTVTNAAGNTPPSFTSDPVNKSGASVDVPYSGSLAGNATDPDAGEILTFNKVGIDN